MSDGTLPLETYRYYMIQDYLYLIQFARANALAAYKAKGLEDIAAVSSCCIECVYSAEISGCQHRDAYPEGDISPHRRVRNLWSPTEGHRGL